MTTESLGRDAPRERQEAKFKLGDQWFYRGNRSDTWYFVASRADGSCQDGIMERVPANEWLYLEEIARLSLPLETVAPSRDWVEFRQQADRGEHPLPPAAPAATPRTESGEWPTPEYAQRIMFEGCDSVVMAPEDYEALYELARTLERENADLRGKLANEINIAAGWKATAEVAEAKLATARADERERCAKVLEARAESVEGPTNAYAVGELYEAALAIRALKEASNG